MTGTTTALEQSESQVWLTSDLAGIERSGWRRKQKAGADYVYVQLHPSLVRRLPVK